MGKITFEMQITDGRVTSKGESLEANATDIAIAISVLEVTKKKLLKDFAKVSNSWEANK